MHMVRPRLTVYTCDGEPALDAALDIAAIRPDAICLFDSWYNIVIHTGSHVAGWIKQVLLICLQASCRPLHALPFRCHAPQEQATKSLNAFKVPSSLSSFCGLSAHSSRRCGGKGQWLQGVLEDPRYEHVAETVALVGAVADKLMASRLPLPRLVRCNQGTSQARFLLARLNPSKTHGNSGHAEVGSVIFTEDVSFDVFMAQLKQLTVT
jgi:hypothetical protein